MKIETHDNCPNLRSGSGLAGTALVVVFVLMTTNFWGATGFGLKTMLVLSSPFLLFFLIVRQSYFKWNLTALFICYVVNILSCLYFRSQDIMATTLAVMPLLFIFYYFGLSYYRIPIAVMENALVLLAYLFCVSYLVQYMVYPIEIFTKFTAEHDAGADVRFRLAGQGISSLGYFYALNQLLCGHSKVKHVALFVISFVVILLMGFRTMTIMLLLSTAFMVFRVHGLRIKSILTIGFGAVCLFFVLQTGVLASKLSSMLERNQTENFGNSDYIRVTQFDYYVNRHFRNGVEYIFGSGYPDLSIGTSSEYGRYMQTIVESGLTWVDWGLISLSWIVGIPAVLVMVWYSAKAIKVKLPIQAVYLNVWFGYLLGLSLTTAEFFREGNMIVQALALYTISAYESVDSKLRGA